MEMQKKIQEMKRYLASAYFTISSPDKSVEITMNGLQEVRECKILKETPQIDKVNLEKAIKEVYNLAIKHSHNLAAEKMKSITGVDLPSGL